MTSEFWLIIGTALALAVLILITARATRAAIRKLEGPIDTVRELCRRSSIAPSMGGYADSSRERAESTKGSARQGSYIQRRRTQIYYQYVFRLVRGVAPHIDSILDVGSGRTSCLEEFHWIPIRRTVDIDYPYTSQTVEGVKIDFLEYEADRKYDLALCLQVLEHIPRVEEFTRKLFDVSHSVLISVPYKWPKGSIKGHIHDPVDEAKLRSWTRRKPDYQAIVPEPFAASRLFAYYHRPDEAFSRKAAQQSMEETLVMLSGSS